MMRSTRNVVVGDGDKSCHTQYEFLPTFLVGGWFADFCATGTGPMGKLGKGVDESARGNHDVLFS